MAKKPKVIEEILKKEKIVDYLSSKGLEPESVSNNRYRYICPIHGPEKEPSFYVFDEGEYQHYHCFGCGSHGDVINIKAHLENKSKGKVIYELSDGFEFGDSSRLKDIGEELQEAIQSRRDKQHAAIVEDAGEMYFKLSTTLYNYLQVVGFDPGEVEFVDKINEKIDKMLHMMDRKSLGIISNGGIDERFDLVKELKKRKKIIDAKKEKELKKQYQSKGWHDKKTI